MERFAIILIAGAALTGSAQASSIVTLQPMKEALGPSMVVLGAPELPDMAGQMGRSGPLLAYPFPGMRAPTIVNAAPEEPVSSETVAAIGGEAERPHRHEAMPMVIRGGLVGDAFARSLAPSPAPAQEVAEEPEQSTASPAQPEFSAPR